MNSLEAITLAEPQIALFICKASVAQPTTDSTGPDAISQQPLLTIHYACVHEVDPEGLRAAFAAGADGVLLYGCFVSQCRTQAGNLAVLKNIHRNTQALTQMNLSPQRLRKEWSAHESPAHLAAVIRDFATQLKPLGPARPQDLAATSAIKAQKGRA